MRIVTTAARLTLILLGTCPGLLFMPGSAPPLAAQQSETRLHLNVNLVQLNIAVTNRKGQYISGLRPQDFAITEDNIPEKIASFEEGNRPVNEVSSSSAEQDGSARMPLLSAPQPIAPEQSPPRTSGANIYILFDTSNYMYHTFVYAQDAIIDFVRSLASEDKVAFYSFSRNLSRAAGLTTNRFDIERGVRSTVAGDEDALYNSLLLTVEDAAPLLGRKAIVVFSNGPDNASSVPPEDVARLAESTGTIIYIISTAAAQEQPVSMAAFERVSRTTGGIAYFASNWRDEKKAFSSIKEDLAHLYTLTYYPRPNPNRGWRTIRVRLVGKDMEKYRVRTRDGYSLQQAATNQGNYAASGMTRDSR
jgi:VWFA-related protein